MPGSDGTGPRGRGPMREEGRGCGNLRGMAGQRSVGRGRCASGYEFSPQSASNRRGDARRIEPSVDSERAALESQAEALRERLGALEARLASTETL